MTRRTAASRAAALAVALLLTAGCGEPAAECPRIPGVRTGLCPLPPEDRPPAPLDVVLPVVGDPAGRLGVGDGAGRVVVVNFWASWCGPCRTEQPELDAAHELLPAGEVLFLGVNIEDSEVNAAAHLTEFAVAYPSVFDPASELAARFGGIGPRTIPSTVIVDRQGRVAVRILGTTTYPELLGLVDALLTEPTASASGAGTPAGGGADDG